MLVLRTCLIVLLACSSEQHAPTNVRPAPSSSDPAPRGDARTAVVAEADAAVTPVDALTAPRTLDAALETLRVRDLGPAADVIARRVAQRQPKMRLSESEALAAASALVELADRDSFRALVAVMPRSAVELARAVRERGVPVAEADTIARYLVHVATTLAFGRLAVFDENHSHVTGREWHEIDYSGENMTWQSQRDYWTPRGVRSFETATDIHAYFVGAEKLPHWKRVYRPRGRMADVTPPAGAPRE